MSSPLACAGWGAGSPVPFLGPVRTAALRGGRRGPAGDDDDAGAQRSGGASPQPEARARPQLPRCHTGPAVHLLSRPPRVSEELELPFLSPGRACAHTRAQTGIERVHAAQRTTVPLPGVTSGPRRRFPGRTWFSLAACWPLRHTHSFPALVGEAVPTPSSSPGCFGCVRGPPSATKPGLDLVSVGRVVGPACICPASAPAAVASLSLCPRVSASGPSCPLGLGALFCGSSLRAVSLRVQACRPLVRLPEVLASRPGPCQVGGHWSRGCSAAHRSHRLPSP